MRQLEACTCVCTEYSVLRTCVMEPGEKCLRMHPPHRLWVLPKRQNLIFGLGDAGDECETVVTRLLIPASTKFHDSTQPRIDLIYLRKQ